MKPDPEIIHVDIDQGYDIVAGMDLFGMIASDLRRDGPASRYLVIADSAVDEYGHTARLKSAMAQEGLDVLSTSFKGESKKTIYTCISLWMALAESHYGKDSALIALGGGVVGDVVGFVASTYERGIPVIQVPTTVLAQADASIGGKNGVNLPGIGKNLVGRIYQPYRVYIDTQLCATLPRQEISYGLAETIKHAVMYDSKFFSWLNDDERAMCMMDANPQLLLEAALNNVRIKRAVVEQDPEEQGKRRTLNFGHTIAHALEEVTDYTMPHGSAVALGMLVEARISERFCGLDSHSRADLIRVIRRYLLPTMLEVDATDETIWKATFADKKSLGGEPRYALPFSIGRPNDFGGEYATVVPKEIVLDALAKSRP